MTPATHPHQLDHRRSALPVPPALPSLADQVRQAAAELTRQRLERLAAARRGAFGAAVERADARRLACLRLLADGRSITPVAIAKRLPEASYGAWANLMRAMQQRGWLSVEPPPLSRPDNAGRNAANHYRITPAGLTALRDLITINGDH